MKRSESSFTSIVSSWAAALLPFTFMSGVPPRTKKKVWNLWFQVKTWVGTRAATQTVPSVSEGLTRPFAHPGGPLNGVSRAPPLRSHVTPEESKSSSSFFLFQLKPSPSGFPKQEVSPVRGRSDCFLLQLFHLEQRRTNKRFTERTARDD